MEVERRKSMEIKEAFHKWTNHGNTLVAYGPRDEGGYSLLEYNGGKPKELTQFEAVALIDEERRPKPIRLREEPESRGSQEEAFPLEEARRLARAILRLDGLTGAEIEAAERVLSVDRADIRRLREIAGNHAMLTPEFFSLNESRDIGQENGSQGIGR
jgi:hypothetical protein